MYGNGNELEDNDFADQHMSTAIVLKGQYRKLARILNELEASLPNDVKIVYRRTHPGKLIVSLEKGDK